MRVNDAKLKYVDSKSKEIRFFGWLRARFPLKRKKYDVGIDPTTSRTRITMLTATPRGQTTRPTQLEMFLI